VGDVIYVAGQAGIDPASGQVAGETFEAQARQAFTNLRALLEDAGCSLADVVKVTCFVTEASAFAQLNELFAEFFPTAPPARSTPVVSLPKGLRFSIEAIASVGR
jgi:2-iminobutanoate/2-iminopropanoate deaminase